MATDILLTDLTNGSLNGSNEWEGTGVFDVLIAAVNSNIEGQYNKGRITSTDFASVYLGGLQSVIAESIKYVLSEKQTEAQIDLLVTQNKSAETTRVNEILKTQLSGWSASFNGGKIDNIPSLVGNTDIKDTFEYLTTDIPTAP